MTSLPPTQQPTVSIETGALPIRITATLFYAVMIMIVGQAFLFTILPPIGRQVGMADYQIGLVMSVHGLFMLFIGPIWGAISEIWGRRRVIIFGGIFFVISVVMFGLIVDAAVNGLVSGITILWMLVGSRALFAFGAGAVTPAAMAMAADLSSRENRLKAISMLTAATSTGAIIGPSVSAFFTGMGLAAPFYIIAAAGIIVVIAPMFLLPNSKKEHKKIGGGYSLLLKGAVLRIAISLILFMCGTYGIFSIVGFFVQDRFDLAPIPAAQTMGLGLMCAAAANVFVQMVIIRRIKYGTRVIVSLGVSFTLLSFLVLWYSNSQAIFIVAMILNGLGQGLTMPALNTSLSLGAGPEAQGHIAGIATATQAIAFLIAPASAAAMYQGEPVLPVLVGSVVVILTMIVFISTKIVDVRTVQSDL